MPPLDDSPPIDADAPPLNARGLIAVIASVGVVALIYALVGPLLAVNLEHRGVDASINGALAAVPSLAVLLCGAFIPRIVQRLGAVASICAGAGVAVLALILFPLLDRLPLWFALRFVMGFSIGLIWIVSETWVNALAPDESRGRIIGIYVTVLSAGAASGPLLVGAMGSTGMLPFFVSAGILALALAPIPIAAAGGGVPTFHHHEALPLRTVARQAPIAMAASVIHGGTTVINMTLLPVYGVRAGLPESQAVWLITALVVGGMLAQIPVGHILDRMNPGRVLMFGGSVQALSAACLPFAIHRGIAVWILLLLWGGFGNSIYTTALTMLGRAYAREHLPSANTAFTMFWELGALFGPLIGGIAMQIWNPHGMIAVSVTAGTLLVILGGLTLRVSRYR
ncbi:MAG TPA: MFS transporter [Candidatus Binatia bacterium]|nr:MFS transporter [Candidatus Binatia bacterium]